MLQVTKVEPSHFYPTEWVTILFSIIENEITISRAEVIEVDVIHSNQIYQVRGICNVFTFPQFRHQGYGKKVVEAATNYIWRSHADIGILFCEPKLELFYASKGWEVVNHAITRIGIPDNYQPYDNSRMMLFISEKGKNNRSALTGQPLYLKSIW